MRGELLGGRCPFLGAKYSTEKASVASQVDSNISPKSVLIVVVFENLLFFSFCGILGSF